jgi:hypothetical protein
MTKRRGRPSAHTRLVVQMNSLVSYYALRVCPRAEARAWWAAARRAQATAPPAIRALLLGRTRVELSPSEAHDALVWAEHLEGWTRNGLPPLWIYPAPPSTSEIERSTLTREC